MVSVTTGERRNLTLSVVNSLGQPVRTLFSGELNAGERTFFWDAGGNPSGVYFISVCGDGMCTTHAMAVTR